MSKYIILSFHECFHSFKIRVKYLKEVIINHFFLLLSLCVILILIYFRFHNNIIQQDNYVGYAKFFENNLKDLPSYESRLFPGLPILIFFLSKITFNYIVSGYLIVILSFIGSYTLLNKITDSKINILPLIFPPVMIGITSLIASESVTIFIIILGVYFFIKGKYSYSALLAGVNYWLRPVGSLFFPAMIVSLYLYSKKESNLKYFVYFLIPILIFMVFNKFYFGTFSPFYQLVAYKALSPYGNDIGFIQIFKDFLRAYQWGQFGILASGLFYFIFFLASLLKIVSEYKKKNDINSAFLITSIICMSIFIFSYSFVPFLENFGRYMVPMIPLIWILLSKKFNNKNYVYAGLIISFFVVIN